jgi:hypothetical protein
MVARHGQARADWMLARLRNVVIYPNLMLMYQVGAQIRVARPLGARLTEVTTFCLAAVGESAAARAKRVVQYADFYGASGVGTPDDLAEFEAGLTDATLTGALAALTTEPTAVEMPGFELRSRYALKPVLDELGMGVAFTDAADFHGIASDIDLKISQVIQEAWVKVDESGTEAAAATAITFDAGAALEPEPTRTVTLDRPFVFLIRHEPTGAVIFMGRVVDPQTGPR